MIYKTKLSLKFKDAAVTVRTSEGHIFVSWKRNIWGSLIDVHSITVLSVSLMLFFHVLEPTMNSNTFLIVS